LGAGVCGIWEQELGASTLEVSSLEGMNLIGISNGERGGQEALDTWIPLQNPLSGGNLVNLMRPGKVFTQLANAAQHLLSLYLLDLS
jgi:hypothetical protein